ncbi:MAG TPA: peptide chain release factor N(5)-glutamine methyltransferase, partial [Roseimicrobium sp.]|nr:peptide chain release factor N(5)-glutamine methyltransferase [Roseimicrobium sp.]
MTVLDVIQKSTEFLTRKGVESPRLQVELLLGHILKLPRLRLYLEHDRELTPPQVDQLRELVKRRGQREPLQHIVGTTSFCGRDFIVNKDVLIPRPETELLAEYAWKWLGSRPGTAPRVLDFGTGSGCLAVTMALQVPKASVTAIDLSAPALAVARSNAAKLGAGERVEFREGDGFSALAAGAPAFDLIISNPPYIEAAEIATLEPEVRDFDPRTALDGG